MVLRLASKLTGWPARLRAFLEEAQSARWRRLSYEFTWVALGQALAAAGCIGGVRLLTDVMTPASYGELVLAVTAVTLAQQVGISPLALAAQRFFAPAREEDKSAVYLAGLRALAWRGGQWLVGVAAVLAVGLWLSIGGVWGLTVLAATMLALVLGFGAILDALHNAARLRAAVAWHQAGSQWLRWAGAAAAVWLLGSEAHIALLGSCCGLGLMCLPRWRVFVRQVRGSTPLPRGEACGAPEWQARLQSYLWPFASWGVLAWAMSASDRWALQMFASTDAVGQYAVLFQLGFFPCVMLADMLQQFLAPILFQRAGGGDDGQRQQRVLHLNRRLVGVGALLLSASTAACWLLSDTMLSLLAGAAFRRHAELLPWMMGAGSLFALGQLAALGIVSGAHSRRLLPAKVGSSLLGIGANLAGAYCWGLPGVVGGSLLGAATYLGWTLVTASRLEREFARDIQARSAPQVPAPHGVVHEVPQSWSHPRKVLSSS